MKINYDRILFAIMIFISMIFSIVIICHNIIPFKYLILLLLLLILWNIGLFYLLVYRSKNKKKKKKKNKVKKILGYVFSSLLVIVLGFITYYLNITMNFLKDVSGSKYKEENFLVLVTSDSKSKSLSDIKNTGYTKNELSNIQKAVDKLSESGINTKKYEDPEKMFNDLFSNKIDSVIIEESFLEILKEQHKYENKFKILDKINIKTKIEIAKEIDVTKNPFAIYISGIDSFGNIATVSRSDVNIVAVVHPKIKQVLLLSIPRDYYVQLRGTTGYRDKLTHAGIYGVETSIGTLEDLLNTNINYYARVNFSSVIKIVDALGGIDVYSKYDFTTAYDAENMYHFSKGYNHMNGQQALAFARERHQIAGGDRIRGLNQQAIIDGVLRKATSPAIMPAFSKILSSLKGTFQTNMEDSDIQKLIKMQLDDMSKWNVTSYGLDGYDSSNYTYSYVGEKLYVMEPNKDSVKQAQELIDKVFKGELLDGTYDKEASNVNNPTHVKPAPVLKEKPTISFKEDPLIIIKGTKFDLLSDVVATDKEDGNLVAKVNIPDTSILTEGKHKIVYTVVDSDNNEVTKERTLIVKTDVNDDTDKETDKKPDDEINKKPGEETDKKPEGDKTPDIESNKKPEGDKTPDKDSNIKPEQDNTNKEE